MSEHWPEVVQVCSALRVTPGVKAGALWGRGQGQNEAVGLTPLLGQPRVSTQGTATPSQGTDVQELQDCAAAAWRGQCSSLVSWHCSEEAPVLPPASAPRQFSYAE